MADKGLYNLLINLQANTAQLQQDMDKAVGILQRSGSRISQITQGIFQGFGQAIGRHAIDGVRTLATALGDLADKGDKAGAILDNFRKLGGAASSIDAAKRAVLGTVDAFDLMRAANEGMVKGIPRLNQNFATLAEFANRFADATGQDTLPVLNQLIDAMGSGAPKALKAFGFELQEGATKVQNQVAVFEQLNSKLNDLAPLSESTKQGQERLAAAISEATKEVGIAINENSELGRVYNELAGYVEGLDWREVGDSIASVSASFATLAQSILPSSEAMADFARGLEFLVGKSKQAKADMLALEIGQLEKEAKHGKRRGGMGEMFDILSESPIEERVRINADQLMKEEAAKELARKKDELQSILNLMLNSGS